MSSKARIGVASVIFIGILFGAVYPTRTYLTQQRELRAAQHKLELFKEQNGRLEVEAKRLESDEIPGARLRATFGGSSVETISDSEGYFSVEFRQNA